MSKLEQVKTQVHDKLMQDMQAAVEALKTKPHQSTEQMAEALMPLAIAMAELSESLALKIEQATMQAEQMSEQYSQMQKESHKIQQMLQYQAQKAEDAKEQVNWTTITMCAIASLIAAILAASLLTLRMPPPTDYRLIQQIIKQELSASTKQTSQASKPQKNKWQR